MNVKNTYVQLFSAICLAILCGIAISCTSNSPASNTVAVNLDIHDNDLVSDKFEHINFVKLESKNGEYIGFIDQLIVTDDYIYIMDINSAGGIFIFTKEGKFVNSIRQEYNTKNGVSRFAKMLVTDKNELLVLDRNRKRINIYTHLGEFLEYITISYLASSIYHTNSQDVILTKIADPCDVMDCNSYATVDYDGTVKAAFFVDSSEYNQIVSCNANQLLTSTSNLLIHATDQTVYQFEDSLSELVNFYFGKYDLPEDYKLMPADQLINEWFFNEQVFSGFNSICGSDSIYWTVYNYNSTQGELDGRFGSLVYFKNSDSWFNINRIDFGASSPSDLDYYFPTSYNDGYFYGVINLQGGDLYTQLERGLSSNFGEFEELNAAIMLSKESDNPIIYGLSIDNPELF